MSPKKSFWWLTLRSGVSESQVGRWPLDHMAHEVWVVEGNRHLSGLWGQINKSQKQLEREINVSGRRAIEMLTYEGLFRDDVFCHLKQERGRNITKNITNTRLYLTLFTVDSFHNSFICWGRFSSIQVTMSWSWAILVIWLKIFFIGWATKCSKEKDLKSSCYDSISRQLHLWWSLVTTVVVKVDPCTCSISSIWMPTLWP